MTSGFGADCSDTEFQCLDQKRCVDKRRRCDAYADCLDQSDEKNCQEVDCHYWQYKCLSTGICVDKRRRCNGERDCDDGSDELDCPNADGDQFPETTVPPGLDDPNGPEECPKTCPSD